MILCFVIVKDKISDQGNKEIHPLMKIDSSS